jgi:hypothetical protein
MPNQRQACTHRHTLDIQARQEHKHGKFAHLDDDDDDDDNNNNNNNNNSCVGIYLLFDGIFSLLEILNMTFYLPSACVNLTAALN